MKALLTTHQGSLEALTCPATDCRKEIDPYDLRLLLEPELFLRWESLSLQRSLDAMGDVVWCPRCHQVCLEEGGSFAQCPSCFFAFCTVCDQVRGSPVPCCQSSFDWMAVFLRGGGA